MPVLMGASMPPLLQNKPDDVTLLVSMGLLVLILLLAALLPSAEKSAFKAAQSKASHIAFSQRLLQLNENAANSSQITQWLEETLTEYFRFSTIRYGLVRDSEWHLQLNMMAGLRQQTRSIQLANQTDGPSIKSLMQGQAVDWFPSQGQNSAAELALPLTYEGELLALLSVSPQAGYQLDHTTRVALQQVSAAAASALHQHRLEYELEQRATQLVLLGEISRRLISLKPLDERWQDIVPLLSQTFKFAKVHIYELQTGQPTLKANSHTASEPATSGQETPPEPVLQCANSGEWNELQTVDGGEAVFHLALPLLVQDRLLGVLYLERAENAHFSDEEIGLAEMLAAQMAIAVLEAQNYAQQQEYNWYNTVMLEVTKHAVQPGDPNAAMRAVLQLTTMLAGASWTLLLLPDEHGERLLIGPSSGLPREFDEEAASTSFDRIELDLEPPYEESARPYPLELPAPLDRSLGDDSCLAMQLSDGQSLLGLLLIGGTVPSRPRQELLAGIAHQLSMRIENSRLIENLATQRSLELELETARNIQRSFLPRSLPEMEGWQVGSTWLAARQVGGDFFDFIPLSSAESDPRWGVVIADVADKGVPAALFMALCRTLLRSIAPDTQDPAEALSRLNRLILSDTHADLFVSLFYAIWLPHEGRIRYANGGHNQPLLFSPEGAVHSLEGSGMVLGVSEKARYQTIERAFKPEEVLVLYTDGVTEAMNQDGVFFGKDGIIQSVKGLMRDSAQSIANDLSQAVGQFASRLDPPDDLTTVVLKRLR